MDPKRVLYAEDEITNRKLIQIRLQKEGIRCDTVENGNEALEQFSKAVYDMVILDNYMPIMNGDQVAREIRKVNPSIPIIGITSDDESAAYLYTCGFNEVLIKPLRGYASIIKILHYLRDEQ